MRRGPSKPKGLVTTATVSASSSLASEAITGAAPVPVPPPKPGGDEDHVGALQQFDDAVGIFERRLPADLRVGACAQAVGDLGAELQFVRHLARGQRLQVRVHGVELHAFHAFRHHAGHGVAAAAAHADHFDPRAEARFFFNFVFQIVHVRIDQPHDAPPSPLRYFKILPSQPAVPAAAPACAFNFAEYIARPAAVLHSGSFISSGQS